RYADRNPAHRPGTREQHDHQDRPPGARPYGRREAVAGEWWWTTRRRRRDRNHARCRDMHLLSGRTIDTGLVGDRQRWAWKSAGTAWCDAAHSAGRQRRKRRGAKGRHTLPETLVCRRATHHGIGAETGGMGLQRRGAWEESMSGNLNAPSTD